MTQPKIDEEKFQTWFHNHISWHIKELTETEGRRAYAAALADAPQPAPDMQGCPICKGCGWVCENHPDLPWESGDPSDCKCGGAGMWCKCELLRRKVEPTQPEGGDAICSSLSSHPDTSKIRTESSGPEASSTPAPAQEYQSIPMTGLQVGDEWRHNPNVPWIYVASIAGLGFGYPSTAEARRPIPTRETAPAPPASHGKRLWSYRRVTTWCTVEDSNNNTVIDLIDPDQIHDEVIRAVVAEHNSAVEELQREVEQLKLWKESAISCTPPLQEIARELNLPLGSDISKGILPEIRQLKSATQRRITYLEDCAKGAAQKEQELRNALDHPITDASWKEILDYILQLKSAPRWIPLSERKPTAEDADENGFVLWQNQLGSLWIDLWSKHQDFIFCSWHAISKVTPEPKPEPDAFEEWSVVALPKNTGDSWQLLPGVYETLAGALLAADTAAAIHNQTMQVVKLAGRRKGEMK